MNDNTTIAIKKTKRPALDIMTVVYGKEKGIAVTTGEAVELAVLECLQRRGIDFLPAPDDAPIVPVVNVAKK